MQPRAVVSADLQRLRMTVAASPIRTTSPALSARLANWETTRRAADIDAVILDWIRSQARTLRMGRRFDA